MKEYIKLKRRIVYRGDVYNDIEGERINVLPRVFDSEYMNGIHDGLKKALSILANDVKDIPAADVVEVRHGMWEERIVDDDELDKYGFFRRRFYCSACGNWNTHGASKYCPHCGARMDGGADDAVD